MNIRTIIYSGVMTALIGLVIGLALTHISQRELRRNRIVFGGAILGFGIGAFYDAVRQEKLKEEE